MTLLSSIATGPSSGRKTSASTRLKAVWKLTICRAGASSSAASCGRMYGSSSKAAMPITPRKKMLPSGPRRAEGSVPTAKNGSSAPPILAPTTSATPKAGEIADCAASDMVSSTTARLELESSAMPAATSAARNGSSPSDSSSVCMVSEARIEPATEPISFRASSIRPTPTMTREISCSRVAWPDMKPTTPIRISTGDSQDRSKDSTWATSEEPISAPRMIASKVASVTSLRLAIDEPIRMVAVLLCSVSVMPSPAARAAKRLPKALPIERRSAAP